MKSIGGGLENLHYHSAFIATGGTPRTLEPMVGWNSSNIYVLRTVDEANKVANSCQGDLQSSFPERLCLLCYKSSDISLGRKVVLVGSSFIAMEIAAFLMKKKECESVTVVCGARSKVNNDVT